MGALVPGGARPYGVGMDNPAIARLEAAIARVERAVEQRNRAAVAMNRRHATLKDRMAEAVAALDQVIARAGGE